MLTYETGVLDDYQLKNFLNFLDNEIGTEYEENEEDIWQNGMYITSRPTLTIYDLTPKEVEKIRDFEQNHLNESMEKQSNLEDEILEDNPYTKDYCEVPDTDTDSKNTNINKSTRKIR